MANAGESETAVINTKGERCCESCGRPYSEEVGTNSHYFDPPYDYRRGYLQYCLACWLAVGPKDSPHS